MRTTEELLLAAKVRDIAIDFAQREFDAGKRKFRKENPDCSDEEFDLAVNRLNSENQWREQIPAAIAVLEEVAEVIQQKRAAR